MSDSFRLSFYKNDVVGNEQDPNTSAPSASRIISVPGDTVEVHTALLYVLDGVGLDVTLWWKDVTSGVWLELTDTLRIQPGSATKVEVPPAALLFTQLGTNVGSVTKFGVGFVSGEVAREHPRYMAIPVSSSVGPGTSVGCSHLLNKWVQVAGSFTGSFDLEGTMDGSNWFKLCTSITGTVVPNIPPMVLAVRANTTTAITGTPSVIMSGVE